MSGYLYGRYAPGRPRTVAAVAAGRRARRAGEVLGLKQWHGLAMRTDKLAVHYQAALTLVGILLWTKP
jgi:hypothetical protein